MDFRLPIPKNWQDFEDICHKLWREIWNDPNAQKNGRQGQPQNGIDIFGIPIYLQEYSGVQCKDRDNRFGSELRTDELRYECGKALLFKPRINSFTIATTSFRDEKIQSFARQISNKNEFPFSVCVWSWEDIESEIIYRSEIFNKYYSGLHITESNQSSICLNRYSSRDHLYAFFSRPYPNTVLPQQFKEFLLPLTYELSDNAYLHGKATRFEIKFFGNIISVIDNGISFNPLIGLNSKLVTAEKHVGSLIFRNFQKKFEKLIKIKYHRKESSELEENHLDIYLPKDFKTNYLKDVLSYTVDLRLAYGRDAAKGMANALEINKELKEINISISQVQNPSAVCQFILEVLTKLKRDQKLVVNVPKHDFLEGIDLIFNDDRLRINMI